MKKPEERLINILVDSRGTVGFIYEDNDDERYPGGWDYE